MIKKPTFGLHTFSSINRMKPEQMDVKQKLIRLTESVNQMKSTLANEDNQIETLEKSNNKNFVLLNQHIKALKKAFNTLADVLMEELETIKDDIYNEIKDSNVIHVKKIEELQEIMFKMKGEKQDQKLIIASLEQELKEKLRNLEKKQEDHLIYVQRLVENSKEDNKVLFEKLKLMINNNVNQFELLSQDQSKKDQFLSDLDNKSSLFADSLNETCKKLNKIEDFVTVNSHEVSTKFNELKTMFIGFNNSFKPEVQNSMNGVKELISKLEDQGSFLKEKVELLTIQQKKNSIEIEKNIQDIQKDFKDNMQEIAGYFKENTGAVIADFENAFLSSNNDMKALNKKLGGLENLFINQKEEVTAMIFEQENLISKRNESFNRAFFELCKEMNIKNPLIL